VIDLGLPLSDAGIVWALASPIIYGLVCLKVNRASYNSVLLAAFVVGFLISYVAYLIEVSLSGIGSHSLTQSWIWFVAFVAVPEEGVKLAALIGLANKRPAYPPLMVACFIGCGFAASENLIYLQSFGDAVVGARFLTATAFHVFNAIIMARLLASKLLQDESFRIMAALATSVVLHGTYDYFIATPSGNEGPFIFVLCFTIAAGMVTLRANKASPAIYGSGAP
jgi:RsiW-degrading membrane proteinase PrsW (M82 family)